MAESGKEEVKEKRQRGRHIFVGAVVALAFVLLGAWLAREFILPKAEPPPAAAEADTGIINWQQVIEAHPDVEEMVAALAAEDITAVEKNIINVLENYTLKRYPIVVYTKNKMQELCNQGKVLMSGSGPTVFGLCGSREEAKSICEQMQEVNRESFWTRTTR
jgi:hypothetical protein